MGKYKLLYELLYAFTFVFDGFAAIYIFFCVMKNILVYKVYGLTFWLMVFLNLAVVSIVATDAIQLKY